MQYSIHTRDGLNIILAPMKDAHSTTLEVMVKAGSAYETQETNGLSHFLEHMFFKGGKTYPTPHSVALTLDAVGADYNAYTGSDYVGYYIKTAPLFFETAVDVLSDMMCHAAFPEPELQREKGVIIQEIAMYEDDPASLVWDRWGRAYYGDNPYGWTTLGPVSNIQQFEQKDFVQHKNNLYTKDNLVIVVAGSISNEKAVLDRIGSAFGSLPESGSVYAPVFPSELAIGSDHHTKHTEQNHLIISLPGIDGGSDNKYAIRVLATALGGTMSSRLFQRIREQEGLCYYIGAGHASSVQYGTLYLRAGMEKGRFEHAHERMLEELTILSQEGISAQEFDNTINYLRGQTQMGIESSNTLSKFLGKQYLLYGSIATLDEQLALYESLTLDHVNGLKEYMNPDRSFSYWIE